MRGDILKRRRRRRLFSRTTCFQVKGRIFKRTNQSDGARHRKVFHSVAKRIFEGEAVSLKKEDIGNSEDDNDDDEGEGEEEDDDTEQESDQDSVKERQRKENERISTRFGEAK